MTKASTPASKRPARIGVSATLIVVFLVVAASLVVMMMAWRTIPPGYVGIVFNKANHQVTTGALQPGWAFINPFTESIQSYPVTVQTYVMVASSEEGIGGNDSIKVQSNEGQQLNLDVTVQFSVKPTETHLLFQDWGGQPIEVIEERVVRHYTRGIVGEVAAQYGWEQINGEGRAEFSNEIQGLLAAEFEKRHLTLISFFVREVHLPEALQTSLTSKIDAQQAAERQKYELEQARTKAEQDQVVAEGQANALKAQAAGEGEAIRIRAEAQAEANERLAQSLTPELIRYMMMEQWDGKLPIFSGGGTTPMIDVSDLVNTGITTPDLAPTPQP